MNETTKKGFWTRRRVILTGLVAGGGLGVFALNRWLDDGSGAEKFLASTPQGHALNAFLKILPDGTIVIATPQAEMGQGVATAVPQIIADELDADWSTIRFENPPVDKDYANYAIAESVIRSFLQMDPGLKQDLARWGLEKVTAILGVNLTGGSTSVFGNYTRYRTMGAAAREMLKQAAADEWGAKVADLKTEKGAVIHPDGRRLTYGALAEAAARLSPPEDPPFKAEKDFVFIGKPVRRLDTPMKVDGSAPFGIDVQLPNMLYAAIRQCPAYGGTVASVDDSAVRGRPGVVEVVRVDDSAVAVIAESTWQAFKAVEDLDIAWAAPDKPLPDLDAQYAQFATDLDREGAPIVHSQGIEEEEENAGSTMKAIFADAPRVVEATYTTPFLAHACMEPMNATARVDGAGETATVEIWAPHQTTTMMVAAASGALGIPGENVTLHSTLLGGGFGRRAETDFVAQAVKIAAAAPGRPVKLTWSREEDIQHDAYRQASTARMKAAVDADGSLSGFEATITGLSVSTSFTTRNPAPFSGTPEKDSGLAAGIAKTPYAVSALQVVFPYDTQPIPVGNWRSVAASHNGFYMECFVDEIAEALGEDPLALRLRLLKDKPRHRALLEQVADTIGWGAPAEPGRGKGLAMVEVFNSRIALAAEVSVEDGWMTVEHLVGAVDCGIVVNPDIVTAQMEGAMLDGMSAALYGEMQFADGAASKGNFDTYRLLKIAEAPKRVDVHLMPQGGHPGGIGEVGLPAVAPALANAHYAATGTRIRRLPFASVEGLTV